MRMPRRHVPSTIDKLGPEIVAELNRLRVDHGWSIDELVQHLAGLGAKVSRSAVGRHVKALPEVVSQMKESRMLAETLARELGDKPEDQLANLNIEMLHSVMLRLMMSQDRGEDGPQDVQFGPEEVMFMARSLQSLASARKTDVERVKVIRAQAAEEAKRAAAERAEEAVKAAPGMTAATVAMVRAAILGEA